jgi:3-deoxy-D-manno-octulosonic-acid transferase
VGGGFNVSVHNVLEPAVYGLPVMFGPNHQKSLEAIALINLGGAFSFVNSFELCTLIANLTTEKMDAIKQVNLNYINNHLGGTELVYNYIKQQLRA